MRRRFKLTEREDDDKTCIVVVNIKNTLTGLVVYTLNDVAHIPENQIVPPPDFSEENRQLFVKGLGKVKNGVNILLDVKKLLRQDDAITIKFMATNQNAANKLINYSKNVPRMVCIFCLLLHKAQPEEVIL
jgi:chemotaxis signal transduction protein